MMMIIWGNVNAAGEPEETEKREKKEEKMVSQPSTGCYPMCEAELIGKLILRQ